MITFLNFIFSFYLFFLFFFISRINVIANYVRVNIDPGKGIYEYEVSFYPSVDSKQIRFELLKQHREILGPAKTFDGVTLYLPYQFENTVRNTLMCDRKHD